MANGQARLAFSLRTVAALLRDIAEFVRDPALPPARLVWGRAFVVAFLVLCVIDFALSFGSDLVLWSAEAAGYEPPLLPDVRMSPVEEWLLVVGFAPVFEELIFRGWLSGRRAALECGARMALVVAVLVAAAILYESGTSLNAALLIQLGALGYALYALVIWFRERNGKREIPAWFDRNYRWFVWGSAIAFGTVHLMNYDDLSGPADLILVLPQTLGGLVLAYTRTRLGLGAAVAQHALFNGVLVAAGA
jgi:membrane protease YdiL (CAAX protease family)